MSRDHLFSDMAQIRYEKESTIEQIFFRGGEVEVYSDLDLTRGLDNLETKSHLFSWTHLNGFTEDNCRFLSELGVSEIYLEDVLSPMSFPFIEIDDFVFILLKDDIFSGNLESANIALFLLKNRVVTFSSSSSKFFNKFLDKRLLVKGSHIVEDRAEYLFLSLFDFFVDRYMDRFKKIKFNYYEHSEKLASGEITHNLIKSLLPIRDQIQKGAFLLEKVEEELTVLSNFFKKEELVRFEDFWDEVHENIKVLNLKSQSLLDNFNNAINLSIAISSSKQNEAMMLLAVLSTFFVPLTFITGLYGMNFTTHSPFNMPELSWKYGYFFALALMLISVLIVFTYLRKKKWIGRSS